MTDPATNCQLIVILDADPEGPARLEAILAVEGLATIILRPPADSADAGRHAVTMAMIQRAQGSNIAVLVLDDAGLAVSTLADGVHVAWSEDVMTRFKAVRGQLPRGAIAGADAGRSRHDAMELGEAGADYVGFGIPQHVGDRETAVQRRQELVAWWVELVELPVVAFDVADEVEAAALAEAGADFVAVELPPRLPAAEAGPWVARMAAAAGHKNVNA
jgi:thiamine-phosphate pyrophosphorylase